MAASSPLSQRLSLVLGPFVGNITYSSVRIWLNVETADSDKNVFVTLKHLMSAPKSEAAKENPEEVRIHKIASPEIVQSGVIECRQTDLGTGIVTFGGLEANSKYAYQLWEDEAHSIPLDLQGLDGSGRDDSDLYFWTLPEDGYGRQLDFLLMSCHHPATKVNDGFQGFAVWNRIPDIMKVNANVRFAILVGDQIYADDVEAQVLTERDPLKRKQLYLSVYKTFWNNIHYRKVLCHLPAVLMWDDHDITDGWGSREDSFTDKRSQVFRDDWRDLFGTAKEMFRIMQASRNPDPLSEDFAGGFDTCFRVGRAGFVVGDLRSNRNIRHAPGPTAGEKKKDWIGRLWNPEQLEAIKKWVRQNKNEIDTLFFVSTVVFSHGAPVVEKYILRMWFWVIDFVNRAARLRVLKKQLRWFNNKVGDLRDDINDSWGSEANQEEADRVLDYLFELQNPPDYGKRLNVVILTGDIHTPGYSTIYSAAPKDWEKIKINGKEWEGRAIIPHIVATPVAYEPFSWVGEAIFRHLTKVVALGGKGTYTSQVSHHFCYRNVVVVSLRSYGEDESHLKVKYYLEEFPEPQVMLFDLNHGAHREAIEWPEFDKPKTLLDKLRFWRKEIPVATRKSEDADIPVTPLDWPASPPS